jgi:hypothetical protein
MVGSRELSFGDALIYLNMAGVLIVLIYSIFLRRSLVKMHLTLDQDKVTPSDYGLLVKNVPASLSREELTKKLEERYSYAGAKISYVNYCYDVEEMVALNEQQADYYKQLGFYKLHVKKQMRSQKLTKSMVKQDL